MVEVRFDRDGSIQGALFRYWADDSCAMIGRAGVNACICDRCSGWCIYVVEVARICI